MTNKEDIYFSSTCKYRKESQELFGFTEIKALNICVHPNFIENKKGTILYQYENEKQSGQLTVHVLFFKFFYFRL